MAWNDGRIKELEEWRSDLTNSLSGFDARMKVLHDGLQEKINTTTARLNNFDEKINNIIDRLNNIETTLSHYPCVNTTEQAAPMQTNSQQPEEVCRQ